MVQKSAADQKLKKQTGTNVWQWTHARIPMAMQ